MIDMQLEVVVVPAPDVVETYRTKTVLLSSGTTAEID
jgi:hypothetical protein